MNKTLSIFIMLGVVMTAALMITSFAQDMVLDDAVGTGEVVVGGIGIPILGGFVTAGAFMLIWWYLLKKRVQ